MIHQAKNNYGYMIRQNAEGWTVTCLTNVRNLHVDSWVTATVLECSKAKKTLNTATKIGESFLAENA
jgi:hypothetical protein